MSQPGIPLARVGGSWTLEDLEDHSIELAKAAETRAAEEARARDDAAAEARAAEDDLARQEAEVAADNAEAEEPANPSASSIDAED